MSTQKLVGEPTDNFDSDLILQEKKLEDEAVNTDLIYKQKLKTIYKEWAENLEAQHKSNVGYPSPLNTISSYMKSRLRTRGATEGAIDYVTECLETKYRRDYNRFREESDIDDLSISLPMIVKDGKPSLFLDHDSTINEIHSLPDLYRITAESPTQATMLLKKKLDQLYNLKQHIKSQTSDIIEFAKTYSLRVVPIPIRKQKPPEAFRGQSEMSKKLRESALMFRVLSEQIDDVADEMEVFKPETDVQKQVVKYWERFVQEFDAIVDAITFIVRFKEEIVRFAADSKVATSRDNWFKVVFDNLDSKNAHGSGVVNAIKTGQVVMTLKRDQEGKIEMDEKGVVIFDVIREYTREDVTDQTKALFKEAQMVTAKESVQKALNAWSRAIVHTEIVGDPIEFWSRAVIAEYKKENITAAERDQLLSSPPTVFYEPKGQRLKEDEIGYNKKYELTNIEHSNERNIARRRQLKSKPFAEKH